MYYWAREFSSALPAGQGYSALPRTIVISIIDFPLFRCEEYHSFFQPLEVTRHTLLSDKMGFHFFELPKLPAEVSGNDMLLLWLSLFKAETEEELEKIADKFLDCGIGHVVIKTGKKGCYIKSQDQTVLEVPAMKGITAIDTIGAGDNFASGFITAILEGKTLKECAEFANVTASISVQSIGATTGVQNRAQVEERLKEYYEQQKD